jgi:hypothetical protein
VLIPSVDDRTGGYIGSAFAWRLAAAERRNRRSGSPPCNGAPLAEIPVAVSTAPVHRTVRTRDAHPIRQLVGRRCAIGILTLLLVSVVVFLATEVLPGNAAYAVLGRNANPTALHRLELQLHLNRPLVDQ